MLYSMAKLRDGVMILGSPHSVDLVQLVVIGGVGNIILGVVLISLRTVDLAQMVVVGWVRSVIPAQVQRTKVGR